MSGTKTLDGGTLANPTNVNNSVINKGGFTDSIDSSGVEAYTFKYTYDPADPNRAKYAEIIITSDHALTFGGGDLTELTFDSGLQTNGSYVYKFDLVNYTANGDLSPAGGDGKILLAIYGVEDPLTNLIPPTTFSVDFI
ncbi:hypothetical protein [Falsiroseomonas sp. HW251]|uniref:hypothetical protein n=1 Tax=Falsiroseomonas sp. HW251 TaxID=3390998 RepID=UPI003D31C6EA